jgi:hypothetical protein
VKVDPGAAVAVIEKPFGVTVDTGDASGIGLGVITGRIARV